MRRFGYVCFKCNEDALLKDESYKGLVNLDIRPILVGKAIIKHKCFNCGAEETVALYDTPRNKEDFKKKVKKQVGVIES